MNISYIDPLKRAWKRSVAILFRPFRIEAWLTIGLAAFLSRLGSSGDWGSGANWNLGGHRGSPDTAALERTGSKVLEILSHPLWLLLIAGALVLLAALLIVVLWLSARGTFVFLDQVASGRAEFRAPWSRHGRLGNSLFLWKAGFSFAWLLPLGIVIAVLYPTLQIRLHEQRWSLPPVSVLVGGGAGLLASLLAIAFVTMLTGEFVVPLMYRHEESVLRAWGRFLPLLRERFAEFFAYALFLLVLCLCVGVAVVLLALATCCVGALLLAIPYVGSVLLLPLLVPGRALGPEFLAQFGPEWETLASLPVSPAAPADPAPPVTPGAGSAPA